MIRNMRLQKAVNIASLSAFVSAAAAQVTPVIMCCVYNFTFIPLPLDPTPCGMGSQRTLSCETSTTTTSNPNDMKIFAGTRNARCKLFDIGANGYWVNIICGTTPPPGAAFVGRLPDGSCCYAVNPLSHPVVADEPVEDVHVNNCGGVCDGGGGEH